MEKLSISPIQIEYSPFPILVSSHCAKEPEYFLPSLVTKTSHDNRIAPGCAISYRNLTRLQHFKCQRRYLLVRSGTFLFFCLKLRARPVSFHSAFATLSKRRNFGCSQSEVQLSQFLLCSSGIRTCFFPLFLSLLEPDRDALENTGDMGGRINF